MKPIFSEGTESTDEHKRHTTPAEAIASGADYLVVGRPIVANRNPKEAADSIIEEIDTAIRSRTQKMRSARDSASPQ